ncbi:MAG: ATP-dependent RecD-like DNA helicase [Clostridia bacterium]|nr:ATP-dependent RecD-like DNA helicase [Clostridia bacterium]
MDNDGQNDGLEVLSGIVESVTYRNADNGYTVLQIDSGGILVCAVGKMPEITAGEELVLRGVWTEHETFGRQFSASSCESRLPESGAQLLRYLSAGAVKGIGRQLAVRIVRRFGDDSVNVLQNEPERLAEIKGISLAKAQTISEEFNRRFALREALAGLSRYGIQPVESLKIFKLFGPACAGIVEHNPYILSEAGFDFFRCDKIASSLGVEKESVNRVRAGILYFLGHNTGNGHTCLPEEKVVPGCAGLLGCSEETVTDGINGLVDFKMLYRVTLGDGRPFLFLPKLYAAEREASDKLRVMLRFPPSKIPTVADDICAAEEEGGFFFDELQKRAITLAVEGGMLILTGGPGTGKTTAVRGMISLFEKYDLKISLAAPTGRAAKRLSEVTGRDAMTIHRLLEVEWSDDEETGTFARDASNPLECDVLIADEVSMIDSVLFASMLDALRLGSRLILVGDSDQLPAVGAGNVLADLIGSGLIPVVRLDTIFRQAGTSLIITGAHKIVEGEVPDTSARDGDFFFLERQTSESAAATVRDLVCTRLPTAYGYDAMTDIQVLTPSHMGECGTKNLNAVLQASLNPPSQVKAAYRSGSRLFRVGDKVMQVRNNYNIEWGSPKESGTGVYNGDIGILRSISLAEGVMTIDFDGRLAKYPFNSLGELELAYAVTVHKSQGSEFPAVVIPIIDVPPKLVYRNLLYTAVTRAKRLLILVGSKKIFADMVENDRRVRRYTALRYFLTADDVARL